ncbi:MAG: tetratricopeptide repeat protein, partial [Acidobacteriota bacterium]
DLYYRQKRAKEGLRALEKFAARKPSDPRIHLRRGQLYIYLEEFEKALAWLEEAVWADPESGPAHFEMARTLRYGNNLEAAQRIALKAVALEPENAQYLHLLGIICDGLKQSAAAVPYLERAAAAPDAFARIYFDLGNALRKSGDRAEARKALENYRELLTANEAQANRFKTVQALINQGQLQIRNGAVGEARTAFLRVLETEPDNWFGHNFLAKIYLSSGAPKLALPHLEQLQQTAPDNSEGNFLWAFYWHQLGDSAQAAPYAEKSKTWRPSDPELRNLLGNIYYRLGRKNEALEEYSAAFKLAPQRADFKANYETLARKLRPDGLLKN